MIDYVVLDWMLDCLMLVERSEYSVSVVYGLESTSGQLLESDLLGSKDEVEFLDEKGREITANLEVFMLLLRLHKLLR